MAGWIGGLACRIGRLTRVCGGVVGLRGRRLRGGCRGTRRGRSGRSAHRHDPRQIGVLLWPAVVSWVYRFGPVRSGHRGPFHRQCVRECRVRRSGGTPEGFSGCVGCRLESVRAPPRMIPPGGRSTATVAVLVLRAGSCRRRLRRHRVSGDRETGERPSRRTETIAPRGTAAPRETLAPRETATPREPPAPRDARTTETLAPRERSHHERRSHHETLAPRDARTTRQLPQLSRDTCTTEGITSDGDGRSDSERRGEGRLVAVPDQRAADPRLRGGHHGLAEDDADRAVGDLGGVPDRRGLPAR